MALYIPTAAEIKKVVDAWKSRQISRNTNSYAAVTFFLLKGAMISRLNYYKSKDIALKQLYYLAGEKGFSSQTPAGSITFKQNGTAQTAGINADLFLPVSAGFSNMPLPYESAKDFITKTNVRDFVVRFFTNTGNGPYYAVFNGRYFGISATIINASGDKAIAMQGFYNNLQKVNAQYNALVASLNELIEKPNDPVTQQVINRLTQRRISLLEEIKNIPGATIITGTDGNISGIGIIPIAYIVVIAIAGAAAWTVSNWITEKAKTDRILQSYNHQTYMAGEQQKILNDVAAGKIPQSTANAALKNLGVAIKTAGEVAEQSAKDKKGIFGEIGDLVKWGVVGFIGFQFMKMQSNK